LSNRAQVKGRSLKMKIDRFMNILFGSLEPLIESPWFKFVILVIISLNPLALLPQVIDALIAPDVSGISLYTFYGFAVVQTAFAFDGIRTKNAKVLFSMIVALIESIIIIVVVHIRMQ